MLDLVKNPEDRFFRNAAQVHTSILANLFANSAPVSMAIFSSAFTKIPHSLTPENTAESLHEKTCLLHM